MSTHALRTSDRVGADEASAAARDSASTGLRLVRNVDLALLVLAVPVFVAAGFPLPGYATGAGAWLVQRAVRALLARRAAAAQDPRAMVGLTAGSMIARGWLVALAIFGVGLADNEAGLAAAVLFLAVFTAHFSVQLVLRPLERTTR